MASIIRRWYLQCFIIVHVDAIISEFGATGKNKTLGPQITGTVDSILWKYQNNKIVEYESQKTEWYRFKTKALLNENTGQLTLLTLDRSFNGSYEYEIQVAGSLKQDRYDFKVIDEVSEPKVTCLPVNENETELQCSLDPVVPASYRWGGPESTTYTGDTIRVPLNGNNGKIYFCYAKNEVSEKNKQFDLKNCPQEKPKPPPVSVTKIVIGVVIAIVIIIAICGFVFFFFKMKKKTALFSVAAPGTAAEHSPMKSGEEGHNL